MRLNKKGFTLVELLVTIVIVGLVIGISTYGIITAINDSEDKSKTISLKNIKEAASIYSSEADSSSWKNADSYDAFCVTVGELMNKGLLDSNAKIKDKVDKDTFIIVKRNKVTLAIEGENIVGELGTEENEICTGQKVAPGEDITTPKITSSTKYTDRIIIDFNAGSAKYQGSNSSVSYTCLYGSSSSNITKEGVIEGSSCKLNDLKHNTPYYVFIYMKTEHGSVVLAESSSNEYKTANFKDTTFTQNKNVVTVTYNDKDSNGNNISPVYHYVKSNTIGTVNTNVEKCTLENDKFNCSESTINIESNVWYKVSGTSINITYAEETNTGINISTRIYDGSNNYKENSKDFIVNKYIVKFYKNGSDSIDGKTSEYVEKYCISKATEACSITSPSIKAAIGHSVVGWNADSSATTSTWNVNAAKNINANATYYAITKPYKIYIRYNVNRGVITKTTDGGTWTTDTDGLIYRNGSIYTYNINYGEKLTSDGLANYNNGSWLNITRSGYSVPSGKEWKCVSGCTDKTYDHTVAYSASDFCDASNGDCTVTLGVNWKIVNYTITYNLNGGSVSGNPTSYNIETATFTLNNPTKTGYTFSGWTGTGLSSVTKPVTISKGSTGNKSYTANWSANSYTYNIVYKSSSGTQLGTDTIKKNYGTTNTVSPKSFIGYTSPSGQSIKWDSTSAKTITFTYTPINYTISYDLAGGSVSGNPTSYNIETATFTLKNPTKTGYTFSGWTETGLSSATKPVTISKGSTGNKSYTANWSANTNTAYKVQHWQQNIDAATTQNSTNYTLKDTENKTGTTGASITPAVKSYTGFKSPSTLTTTIKADGSRVVNYYYTRNSYTVSLTKGTGISSVSGAGSYHYGKSVTINATVGSGYTWSKWTGTHNTTTKQYTFTMPASNVSDTASATADVVITTVNANRFSCEAADRLAVLYVTTCNGTTCTYTKKNGLSSSYSFSMDVIGTPIWSVSSSNFVSSVSDKYSITTNSKTCNRKLLYITASYLNCRGGASTDTDIKNGWSTCTAINVYRTTMKYDSEDNWWYSSTYNCYLSGEYLESSQPSSCNSSSGGGDSSGGGGDSGGSTCVAGRCKCEELCGSDYACYKDGACSCCASAKESPCGPVGGAKICSIHNVPM